MLPAKEATHGRAQARLALRDEEGLVQIGYADCGFGHGQNLDDAPVRILLVSQMYPSAAAPDFGVFVQGLERELAAREDELERVVLDRRGGGKLRHLRLGGRAIRAARRFRPDVVYAHFLFPTGLSGLLAASGPLSARRHRARSGRRELDPVSLLRPPTRRVVKGAAAVIAVSDWLRSRLEESLPAARGKTEVVNCGVDLERFRPLERAAGPPPRSSASAR